MIDIIKRKTYFEKAFNYDLTFPQYFVLIFYQNVISLIVLVIQTCRSDVIIEENFYLITRYWPDVKS